MNLNNMYLAIEILEDVAANNRPFKFTDWVNNTILPNRPLTLKDFSCDTHACAGGYIAADPRTELSLVPTNEIFPKFTPSFNGETFSDALAAWLEIPEPDAEAIFAEADDFFVDILDRGDVTAEHVLVLLNYYLEHDELPEGGALIL